MATNLCEKLISACISADCANPLYAGVDSMGLIANYSDIASVTYDQTNPSIVSGITMKTDTVGSDQVARCWYTIQQLGNKPFEGSQTEFAEGTYANRVTHTIQFAIVDNGPEITENVVDRLLNGKFCVILKNDYVHADGKNKYSVYGLSKGLKCTGLTRELWGDNESAWIVTLTEENAAKTGLFVYATSEQATDSMIEGLKCSCGD
jgi:hypothetical protein